MKAKPSLYLSGSIDYSDDYKVWRNQMYKALHRHYRVIIPEKADCPFEKADYEFREWIRDHTVMKDMVNVATSQYMFVKIDKAVLKGAGTISEITTACWLGKHMIAMLEGVRLTSLPTWMLGCLAGAEFVDSIEEGIEIYKELAKERRQKEKKKDSA
jgi:hypothetical protein